MSNQVKNLLKMHRNKYPKAGARDFYKLIYQGVFGVGHLISEKAKDYLWEEAHRIDLRDYPERGLIEPVSGDGSMVRVYLRPFMRKGLDLEKLFSVMVRSAERDGDEREFLATWNLVIKLVESGELSMDESELMEIQRTIDEKGIIPMHHTEPYREAYYPAYRVVWKPFFDEVFSL